MGLPAGSLLISMSSQLQCLPKPVPSALPSAFRASHPPANQLARSVPISAPSPISTPRSPAAQTGRPVPISAPAPSTGSYRPAAVVTALQPGAGARSDAVSRRSLWLVLIACVAAGFSAFALLRSPSGGSRRSTHSVAESAREPTSQATAPTEQPASQRRSASRSEELGRAANRKESETGREAVAAPPKPGNLAALLAQAKLAMAESRHTEAEALLARMLEVRPDDYYTRFLMALTMLRQRRFEEAHRHLERAIELKPGEPRVWLLKGDALIQEGKPAEAVLAWRRCLKARRGFATCEARVARWSNRQ